MNEINSYWTKALNERKLKKKRNKKNKQIKRKKKRKPN